MNQYEQNAVVELVAGLLTATGAMTFVKRQKDEQRLQVELRPSASRRTVSIVSLGPLNEPFGVAVIDTDGNLFRDLDGFDAYAREVDTSGLLGAIAGAVDVARGAKPIGPYRNSRRRTSRRR